MNHRTARKAEAAPSSREAKTCPRCGRRMEWRKRWERCWDEVRYCSDACRRSRPDRTDHLLESVIRELLRLRGEGKTLCPSEAARAVGEATGQEWRPLMEAARSAARRLTAAGEVTITQGGQPVDPSTAKGPIRIRRVSRQGGLD